MKTHIKPKSWRDVSDIYIPEPKNKPKGRKRPIIAISPEGKREEHAGVEQFIRHKINTEKIYFTPSNILRVLNGESKHAKGWTFEDAEERPKKINKSKKTHKHRKRSKITAISPDGEKYHHKTAVDFIDYAKKNLNMHFHTSEVSRCINGKRETVNGWTFKRDTTIKNQRKGKPIIAISPEGEKSYHDKMSDFVDYALKNLGMVMYVGEISRCVRGLKKDYHGWTFKLQKPWYKFW